MNSYLFAKARTALRLLFVLVLVMGALPLALSSYDTASAAPTTSVLRGGIVINELLIDPNSASYDFDTDGNGDAAILDEFVEIYNLSGAPIDIGGLQLWDDGAGLWFTFPSVILGPGNYAVVIGAVQAGGSLPAVGAGNFAFDAARTAGVLTNSGDNVVLYDPTADQWVQLVYDGDGADNPPVDYPGFSATATLVGAVEDWGSGTDGTSLVRNPAGDTTIAVHALISADYASPGAPTITGGGPGDPCSVTAFTPIYAIQGSGAASPLVTAGTTEDVVTRGIVTADFQDDQRDGFFIQDAAGDGDFDTSDGIFVYEDGFSVPVAVGNEVAIIGDVSEYFGNTQIGTYTSDADHAIQVCGTGSVGSTTVNLPIPDTYATPEDFWEPLEGMYITIPQNLTATDVYELGRYGRVMLSTGGRLENFTQVNSPNVAAYQDHLDNLFRRVVNLDDRSDWQNPPVVIHPDPQLSPTNVLRDGTTVSGLTGVVNYTRSVYRIDPVGAVPFNTAANPRPAAVPAVGGTVQVANFNVLNFFTTIDTGQAICGPTGGLDCRGADTVDEYNRQLAKLVAGLADLDADVVGLAEIENHATDDALTTLVNELNAVVGAGTYAAINTGPIGTDAIKVAMIYKTGVVTPVGAFALLDYTGDAVQNYRPSLLQTFEENASGEVFSVVMNHFKSKGCTDAVGLDLDQGDGQSCYNFTRTAGAVQLAAWLATDPTGSGDPDFLIIGDLNSYAQEDPIVQLGADGFDDLLERFIGYTDSAYTYVYFGEWGTLDYAFASSTLSGQVTGAAEWHINADETPAFDYNNYNQADLFTADQFRSSDHDPIVVGLNLAAVVDGGDGGAAAGVVGPDGLPITSLPGTGYAPQPEAQSNAVSPWLFVALAAVIAVGLTLGGWVLRRTSR